MLILDANALLRYVLHDNEQQYAIVEEAIMDGAYTTAEIIAEVVYVMARVYDIPRSDISWFVHCILLDVTVDNPKALQYAMGLFNQTNLDYVDCLLIAYHKVFGADILSFDKALNKNRDKEHEIYQVDDVERQLGELAFDARYD